jgi:uncharacterized protein (TIGR03083 family)
MSDFLLPVSEVCDAYLDLQTRVYQLASEMSTKDSLKIVPHCPQWRVKDVLGHMVGVPEDAISGAMNGVATPEWTQKQVDRHANHSIEELLSCWEEALKSFKHVLPNIPQPGLSQFVFDQVTHEQDIRHAIGNPGARDSKAMKVAEAFIRDLASRSQNPSVQSLSTCEMSGFDFTRCMSGRRTRSQVQQLGLPVKSFELFFNKIPLDFPEVEVDEI